MGICCSKNVQFAIKIIVVAYNVRDVKYKENV